MNRISIVSPVYQGELLVELLVQRICSAIIPLKINYELILVDDGSSDASWEKIVLVARDHPEIIGIKLTRNFGQQAAIKAGLEFAQSELIVVMDCDLQDKPEDIPVLFAKINEGYDAVFAERSKKNEPPLRKFLSLLFYKSLQLCTGISLHGKVANFGIYTKRTIDLVLNKKTKIFLFPLAVRIAAKKNTTIITEHAKRAAGSTTYSFFSALRLAIFLLAGSSVFSFLIKKDNGAYEKESTINK